MLAHVTMILPFIICFGISNYMSDKRSLKKSRYTIQVGMVAYEELLMVQQEVHY